MNVPGALYLRLHSHKPVTSQLNGWARGSWSSFENSHCSMPVMNNRFLKVDAGQLLVLTLHEANRSGVDRKDLLLIFKISGRSVAIFFYFVPEFHYSGFINGHILYMQRLFQSHMVKKRCSIA